MSNNNHNNNGNPTVWGPKLWFVLHTGAMNYPDNPSETYKKRMKWFLMGLPVILSCDKCMDHAYAYINSRESLDKIVSSRTELFKFFVDMHNAVNVRNNKPVMSYAEAYRLYDSRKI